MDRFIFSGAFDLPWWAITIIALCLTHVTIVAVTLFLHRHQAHHAFDMHPSVSHFFRFWLWLTTGMVTREWAAVHRKHHAKCDTPEDPHSPLVFGLNRVLWGGVFLYVILFGVVPGALVLVTQIVWIPFWAAGVINGIGWLYIRALESLGLATVLPKSRVLTTMITMRRELAAIWGRSAATREQLVLQLQDWCQRAEASGIRPLVEFSERLRRYA